MKIKIKPALKWIIKAFHTSFDNFCAHTYVHAFQYLSNVSQPSSKIFDKIFWTIVISTMLVLSTVGCDLFLNRFNANGIKNYILSDHTSIGLVPFPAITVCPTEKISSSKLEMIIQNNNLEGINLTLLHESLKYFDFNNIHNFPISDAGINVLSTFINATKFDIFELIKLVSYNCNELLIKCRWQGVIVSCKKLFKLSTSYEGFCCSFNYDDEHRINSSPIKTNYFGITNGLSFALNIPKVTDYTASHYGTAVKVLIHKRESYAINTVPEVIIAPTTETVIFIKPQVTIANDEVKSLAVPSRNCYLKEELKLEYFEAYSVHNCLAERIMNRIYDFCSCVPYFYHTYTNFTVCDETAIKCFYKNIDKIIQITSTRDNNDEWPCLYTCNKFSYPYHLLTTKFISPKYTINPFYTGLSENHSVVHVTMSKQTMRITKSELSLNWIQLISSIGGVVSLFTGVSLVSFTHMLYFFTVKWMINIHKEYKRSKIIKKRIRFHRRLRNFEKY